MDFFNLKLLKQYEEQSESKGELIIQYSIKELLMMEQTEATIQTFEVLE